MKAKQTKRNKPITKTELDYEAAKRTFAIATSIYKANSAYDKASEAQRRVMIAEDALQQLKMGRFCAKPGLYVNAYKLADEGRIKGEVQLNTLLHDPTLKSPCDVCARGALLLSAVRFRNDCTIDVDGFTSEDSWVKEFSNQQEVIEAAFDDCGAGNPWCEKFLTKKERADETKRLELILKNIVRNKGTFKPTQR